MAKKTTAAPDDLSKQEKNRLWQWCKEHYPKFATKGHIQYFVDECLDHHASRGLERVDWARTCRNWMRKGIEMGWHPWAGQRSYRDREYPKEHGPGRANDPSRLGDVINLADFKTG
jgi:hypothetical protein